MPERRLLSRTALFPSWALTLAAIACSGGTEKPPGAAKMVSAVADSLVLTTSNGTEVWFTLLRPASNGNGRRCLERGLEIRYQEKRTRVPLLYTGAAPELLNDTVMRAMLWKDCMPGVPYLVNLRTGQPVPERAANKL